MKRAKIALAGLLYCCLLAPQSASAIVHQQLAGDPPLPGRLYVQFTESQPAIAAGRTGMEAFDRTASRYNVTAIEKAFPSIDVVAANRSLPPSMEALSRVYVVRYNTMDSPHRVAADFARIPMVKYAEPVYAAQSLDNSTVAQPFVIPTSAAGSPQDPQAMPDDPYYANSNTDWDQAGLPYMGLEAAWDITKGDSGSVVVAIVYGGFFWRHTDLVDNIWVNTGETEGDGLDNDDNGFVDDIHGWNFPANGPEIEGPNTNYNGFTTAMYSGAGAATNNNLGVAAPSWNVEVMGINGFCETPNSSGSYAICYALEGLVYAALNGADVVLVAWGYLGLSETQELVYQAVTNAGTLIVGSVGGHAQSRRDFDLNPHWPSAHPLSLSVGGIGEQTDGYKSNYGTTVNVFAPSDSLMFAYPALSNCTNCIVRWGGSAFAGAMVTGTAALVKTAFPSYTAHQVREHIRLTAVSIDGANPTPGKYGRGKVDALAAVSTAPALPAIRVAEWSYQNRDGTPEMFTTDTMTVNVAFTNYFANGNGINAEWTSDQNFLEWPTGTTASLGSMNQGDTVNVSFDFALGSTAPNEGSVMINPRITAGSFADRPDMFYIPYNQASIELIADVTSMHEGDDAATVTISAYSSERLVGARALPLTVRGSGVDGTVNFAPVADFNLVFPADTLVYSATFTLTPIDNMADEADETVTISSSHGLVTRYATVTLIDNDDAPSGISLSAYPMSVNEGDGDTTITVTGTVTGGTTYGAAQSLDLKVEGSGVTGVVDFTPISGVTLDLAAAAGSGTATFVLSPTDNTDANADETIIISSSNPLVTDSARVTLYDDDGAPIALSVDPMTVSEGAGATTVTVTASTSTTFTDAKVLPITVAGSGLASAVDFTDVPGFDLTLAANESSISGTFTLTPTDDVVDEEDEMLSITSSHAEVGTPATLILQDDDNAPDGVTLSVSPHEVREDDGATTITVTASVSGSTLYASEKMMNVTLTGTGVAGAVDFTMVPEFSLTMAAEAAAGTANFVLTPENDTEGEADETITISSDSSFVLSDAMLIIRDDDGGRTGSDEEPEVVEFSVAPPYPNPASGAITFVLSSPGSADWTRLRLYNLLGQVVAIPYEGALRAGQHTVRYDGRHLPAGVYVYVFESHDTRVTGQLIMTQ